MRNLERAVLLQIIDERWREHLYDMDYLREGIHLRGFAQKDPLVEYKNEGFALFRDLMNSIWEDFGRYIFHVEVEIEPAAGRDDAAARSLAARSAREPHATPAAAPSSRRRSTTPPSRPASRRRRPRTAGRSTRRCPRSRRATSTSGTRSAATTRAGAARARSTRSATGPRRSDRWPTSSIEQLRRARLEAPRPAEAARGLPLTRLR